MNERIRELALEAFQPINDITTEGVADRRTFDQAWFQHYNEKFAELIVRECAKFIEDISGYDDSNNAWHPEPEELLKHFGVEE